MGGEHMRRCVIVGGAAIGDYSFTRGMPRGTDYTVYCDSGLRHMEHLHAKPDLIVGDFDSHEKPHLDVETVVLPREKDDTDTVYAVREAVRRGFDVFLLLGAVGGRFDHSLGNMSILMYLDSMGKRGCIVDDYSEMEIVSREPVCVSNGYACFSLLAIGGGAAGVSIAGAKYPLENAEIGCDYQYGISNEVLPGGIARISVQKGRLLLIKVRRDSEL